MCGVMSSRRRLVMTRWVCRRWVGEHPIPSEEEEEWTLPRVLKVWQNLADKPRFRIHYYVVFVEWLRRTFGEEGGEFYWRHIHKIREDRIPSLIRLISCWGWESLKRTLIRLCLELWEGLFDTPRPIE